MTVRFTAEYPYVFPPVRFFQKAALAEHLVLADSFRFPRQERINRYRVLGFVGCVSLAVPVRRRDRSGPIRKIMLAGGGRDWRVGHWKTLTNVYGASPYFDYYADEIRALISTSAGSYLDYAEGTIRWVLSKLGLAVTCHLLSELAPGLSGDAALLRAAQRLGANVYVMLAGQKDVRDEGFLQDAGVSVQPVPAGEVRYHRLSETPCPSVSILDVLVNEGPEAGRVIRESLADASTLRLP